MIAGVVQGRAVEPSGLAARTTTRCSGPSKAALACAHRKGGSPVAEREFFLPDASGRAAAVVAEVEKQTGAEVVVAVRRSSGRYTGADYLWGALFAFATLLLLLFLPQEFQLWTIPVDVIVSFGLAAFASSRSYWLRRALTLPSTRRANALSAARACFVEAGVSRTRDRGGLLVYVTLLERQVVLVPDVGFDAAKLHAATADAVATMERALGASPDFGALLTGLTRLGPPLATLLPRREDDVNELSDELAA